MLNIFCSDSYNRSVSCLVYVGAFSWVTREVRVLQYRGLIKHNLLTMSREDFKPSISGFVVFSASNQQTNSNSTTVMAVIIRS